MEEYISISYLNDFIFCPYSIYFHSLYNNFEEKSFQTKVQVKGKETHESIDKGYYSRSLDIITSKFVLSEKYKLCGRIDVYNKKTKTLVERKRKITTIFDGYIMQLYAQYFCLKEEGYEVENLELYSYLDNKKYKVDLPEIDNNAYQNFLMLLKEIEEFNLNMKKEINPNKCKRCIYINMCDKGDYDI